jgi:hypothetical protein
MPLKDKLHPDGQKRLLAIDGGGIRGVLSLEVLKKIEDILRSRSNHGADFRLSDYFDYIAGTSTGGIIAAGLSIGMSVDEVMRFYVDAGPQMFVKANLIRRLRAKFEDEPLANMLKQVFGADTTLGSERLRTLLLLVMRNATTDSPWPISNNPYAKYNDRVRDDCNLNIPLWQLVRASTAAPTYFPPEVVVFGGHEFVFVDGGMTMYNNPTFQMFLMATVDRFWSSAPQGLRGWRTGTEDMLVVSIGTGTSPDARNGLEPREMNLLFNAATIPSALMFAALNEQDFLCRVFGDCLAGDQLDREIGDMAGATGPASPKLFTYLRYNAELTEQGLAAIKCGHITPDSVRKLDAVEAIPDLRAVGRAVAEAHVAPSHFDRFPPA